MRTLVCTLALFAFISVACSPPPSPGPSDISLAAGLNSYLDQQAANLSFSGAALIVHDGRVLVQKGYGFSSRYWRRPNTEHTQFRIASITKQFTAVSILLLQSRGKLDVHDRLCAYLPDCPLAWHAITLHHLLTHTSGVHSLYETPGYTAWQATPAPPTQVMQHYFDLPLDFPPGTSWRYTNSGYELLGLVIERASGMPYERFLHENIFTPLGMRHTGILGATQLASGYANSYDLTPAETSHPTVDYASGGLYSTVGDLYLWDEALFSDEFLSPALRELAFSAYESMAESGGLGYGYGFMLGEIRGHPFVGHAGRLEGYSSLNYYFPGDRLTLILLGNQRNPPVRGLAVSLATMLWDVGD